MENLTPKQRRFVEEYTKDWNASGAAFRAGYSEKTCGVIGYENLKKPEIKKAIDDRVEAHCMSANEALIRMSDFGRGKMTPFLGIDDQSNVVVDLASLPAQENLHLIKKLKQTRRTIMGDPKKGVPNITEVYTEIEIHDSKDAVAKVLQMHGKLIDRKTIDHTSGGLPVESTTIVFGKGIQDVENSENQ
ncbi:terminase small subunit [Dyadobacter sp. OTU695]|uniref:terminase small subunit n=1 Tax=Dyadobacter sp. OTU695 TaxID=3043860 RepID=UPI00313EF841